MRAHASAFLHPEPPPAPWIVILDSNPHGQHLSSPGRHASCIPPLNEMESKSDNLLGSPRSSLQGEEPIRSAKSSSKNQSPKSSDGRDDDGGSLAVKWSDLEAAGDGNLACHASELGLNKKAQVYTLRRNPRPSKRFKVEEYAMESVPSAAVKKSMILMGEGYECSECGRRFGSSKALFGHMRCHPEREWRGINPPKGGNQSPSNVRQQNPPSRFGNHTINLHSESGTDAESIEAAYMHGEFESDLQSWTRGKRSRKSMKPRQTIHSPLAIKDDKDMADCLVLLAHAGEIQVQLEPVRKRAAFGLIDRGNRSEHIKAGSKVEGAEARDWNRSKIDSRREESCEFAESNERREKEETGEGDAGFKYECDSCKRVFKSHQALGGHRASHRKAKGCSARAHSSESCLYGADDDLTEEDPPIVKPKSRQPNQGMDGENAIPNNKLKMRSKSAPMKRFKGHECSMCHKVFQSGQALGGHKRRHWGWPAPSDTSTPHSHSQKHQVGCLEKRIMSKEELLDLNLPAPEDVADDPKEVAGNSIHDFMVTPMRVHVPSHPSRLSPMLNAPNEKFLIDDGAPNMESSRPLTMCFSKKPSNSKVTHCATQDVSKAFQDVADSSAFHPWYVRINIYDQVPTSPSDHQNHERTYTSAIALVSSLTPISA